MQAIQNGPIFLPDRVVEDACLLFEDKILGIVPRGEVPEGAGVIDARGNAVIPGLIDMHIHGYLGYDSSDGSLDGLRAMAEVETGFEAGGFVEILSGLEEGDAVILK